MKKLVFTLWFIIGMVLNLFSQHFVGEVVDQISQETMPFVDVYFAELHTGTTTDKNGTFLIEHYPNKKINIQISFVGYKTLQQEINLSLQAKAKFYLEPSHVELEEVEVSAISDKLRKENIVSIASKKLEELLETAPTSLAAAISNIPGVQQNSTGIGIGKPVIRGLSGNRIVTYAQGIRIENQQWGAEHGLGVGRVGIEKVEVIKGPASLLYGSDALGGVLYFVDERYADHNTVEAFVNSKYISNTLGTMNSAGFKIHKREIKLNVFGSYDSHADYQIPDGSRVLNTRFHNANFKTSLGFNTKNVITNIRYSFLQNNFGITEGGAFKSTSKSRTLLVPFQPIKTHNVSVENTIFTGDSKVNLIFGYTNNSRKEFGDNYQAPGLNMGLQTYTYNLKWYSDSIHKKIHLIVGSQGMHQSNKNKGSELLIPDANTDDLGAFTIVNYDFEKIHFQSGIRLDSRKINAQPFTSDGVVIAKFNKRFSSFNYSFGGVYNWSKITFRANISSGFRAPNTSELLSYGRHDGAIRFERGNNTLQNEQATQADLTLDYRNEHFNFAVHPFYNYIRNYIYLIPTNLSINNFLVYDYVQTNAFLYGGEIGGHLHPHGLHWLHLESNLSIVLAKDANGNALPLIPATRLNSILKVKFSQKHIFNIKNIYMRYIHKFNQNRIGLFETPTAAYDLIHLGLNANINLKNNPIAFSAGVKNLLNTTYMDHLSRYKKLGIPNMGRMFFISIKIGLKQKIG